MLKSFFSFLIWTTVFTTVMTAQYSFVNYDYTNGLPLDEIKVITEDSMGYIWLGGPLGLSRFDGSNFTHYFRDSPTDEIAGNIVNNIGLTPSGDVIAVYDDNGLSIYDHEEGTFRSKNYSEEDSQSFPKHSLVFVRAFNDTTAYLGANKEGLYHINLKTFKSRKLPIGFIPFDMIEDPEVEGGFLLTGGGLKKVDVNDFSVKKLTTTGFGNLTIINDDVWFNGYTSYVTKYNLKTKQETKYNLGYDGVVRGWCFVDGNLWVGTAEGLEVIDTATSEVITVMKPRGSAKDLQGSFIYDVFKDSKNRVWVSTNGGLSLYDPTKVNYERTKWLPFQSTHLAPLSNNEYLSLDFYGNDIVHFDNKKNGTKIEINNKLEGPLHIISEGGSTYVIFYNGIGKYDPRTKSVNVSPSPYTRIDVKGLLQVLIQEDIWMGIYKRQNKFFAWNTLSNEIDTIALDGVPRGMIDTNDGNIWIYGVDLLWKYNLKDNTAARIPLTSDEYAVLSGDIVQIDKVNDYYWISSRINGIWKASYKNENFSLEKHYDQSKGLTNTKIVQCYLDNYNTFYVHCRSGVFMYDNDNDRFVAIGGRSELNAHTSYGLAVVDSVFHVLGYQCMSIDLRKVSKSERELKTIIEDIRVNGEKKTSIKGKKTNLSYNENNIGISFNTFEYTDPSSIRHRYRLDTLNDWVYNEPNVRAIQLSALASGDYLFQLSASNGNGLWSKPIEWGFSISTPYWKSWWFTLLILSLLLLIGYVVFNYRVKQMGRINSMKVKLAELEGESLRAQMNPHFVFNALNSIKSYIIKNSKEEAADYLTTFSELIRAVLRNSTQKEISLKNELEALTLYLQIENLRLNQPFEYKIDIANDVNPATIAFPPLIIQPFVENSIWHGFVHKKAGGNLIIDIRKEGEKLSLDVIDDGIGREKSKEIEKSRERKRSYGIAITETRLNNIADKADIQIVDLYDKDGIGNGTKVHIELPLRRIEAKNH